MSKLNNINENEEKEISFFNINPLKSNKSNNSSNNESNKNKKYKSNKSIPKVILSLKNSEKSSDKKELEELNAQIKFKRKEKKFKTLKQNKETFVTFEKMIKKKRLKTNRVKKKTIKKKKIELDLPKDKENGEGEIKEDIEQEEFDDKEMKTKLDLIFEKKFLPTETMLSYCKCQLYISYDNFSGFDNTGLEGILCVIINRVFSNLYLQIYDIMDFKKQFEIELYTNISLNKGYEILTEKFHTIEYPTFCLGINFYTKKKAEEIKNIILNYSKALNSSLFYAYEKKSHDSFQNKKIFDFITNPKKFINNTEENKKISKDTISKQINNKNKIKTNIKNDEKENNNDYLGQIFDKTLKKLNYKISSDEQMLSFALDTESNELVFETSKGANRFLEQNNIEISIINEEYEKMKEKIKSKMKVNKLESRKTRKSLQEELKDKENKEKINDILNQIEGLQSKDKNLFNLEDEEKQKLDNKIKKFNITKRLSINQKLQINSSPDNMIFIEDDSDDLENLEEGEEIEDEEDEEGEEIEDLGKKGDEEEQKISSSFNDTNNIQENNNINNNKINNNEIKDNKIVNNNVNNINNKKNFLFNSRLSIIKKPQRNSSEISSNSLKENNNINIKNSFNNKSNDENEIESIKENKSSILDE